MDIYYRRIHNIIDRSSTLILKNPNVVGIARSYKIINGYKTDVPCLTVFVERKANKDMLSFNDLIPKFISGSLTDVIESGKINQYSDYRRPAVGGLSISVKPKSKVISGTIGYAVTDTPQKKNLYILTSCHALSEYGKEDTKGKIVYQPALDNGGDIQKTDHQIGTVDRIIPLKESKTGDEAEFNSVDAGLVLVGTNTDIRRKNKLAPEFNDNVKLVGIVDAFEDDLGGAAIRVHATSGIKIGEILSEKSAWKQTMNISPSKTGEVIYKNQILCSIKCQNGDSGALGYVKLGGKPKAFGILWGGASSEKIGDIGIFSPINKVLELLNVELIY